MKKFNKFFNNKDEQNIRLKLSKASKSELKVSKSSSKDNSPSLKIKGKKSGGFASKGGSVVRGQTVIVKSNYQMAGRQQKDGTRATKAQVGSHASASLEYMNNHGAEDIKDQDLSNIYDENGDRLSQKEFKELKNEWNENKEFLGMRRTVIDPGQQDYISREKMVDLVKGSMEDFMQKTDKSFDYKIAIHTDKIETGGNIHAHVITTGTNRDINMTRGQLKDFKEIVAKKTEQTLLQKDLSLDKSINKKLDKEIAKTQEKNVSKDITKEQKQDLHKTADKEFKDMTDEILKDLQKDNTKSLELK